MVEFKCVLCDSLDCQQIYPSSGWDVYWYCNYCKLRFLDPCKRLSLVEELERYALHQNNPQDESHRKFVQPLVDQVLQRFSPTCRGLDFGCGPSSTVGSLLQESGFKISFFDPFFLNHPEVLSGLYDFIIVCEALEHFYAPAIELERLRGLLRSGGALIIGTQLALPLEEMDSVHFKNWYYRRDPTHVCFFSAETFAWIKEHMSFSDLEILGKNLVLLTK